MKLSSLLNSKVTTILGAAALVAVAGGTGAYAVTQITTSQIADNTILSQDVHDGTLYGTDIRNGTITGADLGDGRVGEVDLSSAVKDKLNKQGLSLGDTNWSVIDRNVIGNGDAALRVGPTVGPDGPPMGVGSLGLHTGAGTDKVAFGDQSTFAGKPLADMTSPSYYEFVTGEDLGAYVQNRPNLQLEVNPNDSAGHHYSTLVFVPQGAPEANKWHQVDASAAAGWYLTGAAGTTAGCNETTYCTLAEINAALPDATVLSVQFSKGRDYAFSGAVDKLAIGGVTYDFEPTGVMH